MKRLRIGLTGGIGSGKSTVAALLVDCGAALVDTDLIARAADGTGGAAIDELRAAFGADVIDAATAPSTGRACARSRSPIRSPAGVSKPSCTR